MTFPPPPVPPLPADAEARLALVFERALVGLSEIGPDGRFLRANPELCRIVGRTADEMRQLTIVDVTHPDDVPPSLAGAARVLREGGSATLEKRYRRPDGSVVVAQSSITRLDAPGQPPVLLAVTVDLTARRAAEAALRESEARLRSLADELEQRVQARTRTLRELLARVEGVQDEERRRIARELHDSLGQCLSSLALAVSGVAQRLDDPLARERLDTLRALLQRTDHELDRMVFSLRPTALEDCGLADGIAAYAATWSELSGLPVDLELHGLEGQRLSARVEAAVFRVVQEALTNVVKHASATRVCVSVERHRRQLRASIEDDGRGFDPASADAPAPAAPAAPGVRGWGLLGMQERIEALGGAFELESAPGAGTTVLLRVPLG